MKEAFKNRKVLISVLVILTAVIILGISYAYFSATVDETNKTESVIQTKKLSITFEGTSEINVQNIVPGWSGEKRFSVENTSNSKVNYNIFMENITNGFGNDLTYSLYETDSTGNTIISTLVDGESLPATNANKTNLKEDIEINGSAKKYYKMVITFEYKNTPQNEFQGASFSGTVGIEAGVRKDVAIVSGETINASSLTSGDSVTREFQIFNYANQASSYDLKLSDVVNTYASGLTYSLTKNGTQVISNTAMPTTDTVLLSDQTIASGATDRYVMTITYDTSSANVDGYKLLENEVNTFSANISSIKLVNYTCSGNNCPKCVRATRLHVNKCRSASNKGCQAGGIAYDANITYGTLGTSGATPVAGDAFDCDVNGDGNYDRNSERFYYVSNAWRNGTFNNDTAVLIAANSFNGSTVDNTATVTWTTNVQWPNYAGPITSSAVLPLTDDWNNVSLELGTTRNIYAGPYGESNYVVNSNFSYEEKAARLINDHEIYAASCTVNLQTCPWLLENTNYDNSAYASYWTETPAGHQGDADGVYYIDGGASCLNWVYVRSQLGVRPAIEVLKTDIQY